MAPINVTFDLKGSTVDRKSKSVNLSSDDRVMEAINEGRTFPPMYQTFKDMDVKNPFVIGPEAKAALITQLVADTTFLHTHQIMDYSLIVGVHQCDGQCRHPSNIAAATMRLDSPRSSGHSQKLRSGLPGTWEGAECFFLLGIVDILQKFDISKKIEQSIKIRILRKNIKGISAVNPDLYAERFVKENMAKFV